jgi:hypothetical protein
MHADVTEITQSPYLSSQILGHNGFFLDRDYLNDVVIISFYHSTKQSQICKCVPTYILDDGKPQRMILAELASIGPNPLLYVFCKLNTASLGTPT